MKAQLKAVHPVLMVRDVPASLRFYARLGFGELFVDMPDDPKYAVVRRDAVTLHLQWHDAAEWSYPNDRPTYRFVVADIDALSAEVDGTGEPLDRTKVEDTQWGTREFHVRDPDKNGLQFYRDR
jgi:catechol 2,3-dioxygenase-like lactoylglutathione lyase family enzyme